MYVDALCHGIDELPTVPDQIRSGLMQERAEKGDEWLLGELERLDPEYYGVVDRRNMKRVFHAVEIIRASGRTYTSQRTGVRREREFRVDMMVEAGLEEEARRVYPMRHLNSLNTVGLKEMFAWFDGQMDRRTAIERIKKNTRVYAKKQLTWWARDPEIKRLPYSDLI